MQHIYIYIYIYITVKTCSFDHGDNNIKSSKNATRIIFVAVISGHGRQSSWILITFFNNQLFITNLVTSYNIFKDMCSKSMTRAR